MEVPPVRDAEALDAALVRRAQAGDRAAFGALVERHYADCLRYAVRFLQDRAEAEEAVQDAFLRAHRSLRDYEDRERFRGWLFRIVVNRCRTRGARLRRWRGRLALYRELHPGSPASDQVDDGWSDAVQAALARLPRDQREAFLLKHVEEMSYEEMAEATGEGVSALKMRVKRARDRLHELLRGHVGA